MLKRDRKLAKQLTSWFKETLEKTQSMVSNQIAVFTSIASQVDLLNWAEEVTKSAKATIYDKALDSEYLRTHIGGGNHRLFDGGHDLLNAIKRVRDASTDDFFKDEVLGYIEAIWKDMTTAKGLPFKNLDKSSYDEFAEKVASWNIPGLNKEYLADLVSFDFFEVLSVGIAAAAVIFALNSDDQKKLAEILGSIGITSILSANPLAGIFVVLISGYAYYAKDKEFHGGEAAKGAALAGLSFAIFSFFGMHLLIELGLVIVVGSLTKKYVLNNTVLHELVLRELKNIPSIVSKINIDIVDLVSRKMKDYKEAG